MSRSKVNIDISLQTKNFQRGMTKVQGSLSKTNAVLGSFLGNLGANLFASFASRAVGAFGSIVRGAADLEQTTQVFSSLTGSMETAKKVVKDLRKTAASTPFQLEGLNKSAQQLLTLNSVTDKNLIPTLRRLGDAAALGNGDLEGLTRAFVKVKSNGRLTAETFDQLIERSPAMAQSLLEASGFKGMGALRKAMSEGKVSADVLDSALKRFTSEGGLGFQAMAKQSKTLGGLISTLKDGFANMAVDVGSKLLPIFKNLVVAFSEFLDNNAEAIISGISAVMGTLGRAALITGNYLGQLGAVIGENKLLFGAVALAIGAAVAPITTLATAVAALYVAWDNNLGGIKDLTRQWSIEVEGVFSSIPLIIEQFKNDATANLLDFSAQALTSIAPLETGFRIVFATIVEAWASTAGTLLQSVIDVGAKVASVFGVELPASIVNFKENLLSAADAIRENDGAVTSSAANLKAQAQAYRDSNTAIDEKIAKIDEETTARQVAAEQEVALAKKKQEAKAQTADATSAKERLQREEKLAAEQELNAALSESDRAFQEEKQIRRDIEKEYEAANFAEKAELLKNHLGVVATQTAFAQIQELKAKGKHIEAKAKLDELYRQGRQKGFELAIKKREEDARKHQKQLAKDREKARKDKATKEKKAAAEAKKTREQNERAQVQGTRQMLSDLASLRSSENKQAAAVGKAAAIAQATTDTYRGAQASYAAMAGIPVVGPALGAAAAAAAIAAGLARVSSIKSQPTPKFEFGGIVPGSSNAGDNILARVNSGEMVLNRSQQAQLFNIANGSGGDNAGLREAIQALGERIAGLEIVMVADDTEIARSASRGVQNGIEIGVSR